MRENKSHIRNDANEHHASVVTNDHSQTVSIPAKQAGRGSSVNGGELFFLALATCYCNDIYREATKRSIQIESVEVNVAGEFSVPGEPAHHVTYHAKVALNASEDAIRSLMIDTDRLAEIHNTSRVVTPVTLGEADIVSIEG